MNLNKNVIITCAITGAGDSANKSDKVPVTPREIADSAIEAAKAGAAIAHIHVRDLETRQASRDIALYEEVSRLIREADIDIILNLTAGMGGEFVPDTKDASKAGPTADMITVDERVKHIELIKPDIATLDCGSVNFDTYTYVATMDMLRETAKKITAAGVKAEIEAFDLGHVYQAKTLMEEGVLPKDSLFQLCMGVPYGAEATTHNLLAMINALPKDAKWSTFALGREEMPWVAQGVLNGGHVRVGLEDNIYLDKGVYATNGDLVKKARNIIEGMGCNVLDDVSEVRKILNLPKKY